MKLEEVVSGRITKGTDGQADRQVSRRSLARPAALLYSSTDNRSFVVICGVLQPR
jgi:hypothetical protein